MNKKLLWVKIVKAILIFILFRYSWLFQLIPVFVFGLDINNLTNETGIFLSGFSSLFLALILFFIYRNDIIDEFKKFKNKFLSNLDTGLKYWVLGLCGMMVSNFIISLLFNSGQAGNEEAVQSMIGTLPWLMFITAGFLAPWNEEIIFRKSLKDIFSKKWIYVFASGTLFGLAHVIGNIDVWTDWLFILPYGSLGLAFAASYYDTDTVFTPMIFHMIHNAVLVLLSIF